MYNVNACGVENIPFTTSGSRINVCICRRQGRGVAVKTDIGRSNLELNKISILTKITLSLSLLDLKRGQAHARAGMLMRG